MPIVSIQGKGKIYSGETPLACSIKIEQTGSYQITFRAGSFADTGQAKVYPECKCLEDLPEAQRAVVEKKLNDGECEWSEHGLRHWLKDGAGNLQWGKTTTLLADVVVDLSLPPADGLSFAVALYRDGAGLGSIELIEKSGLRSIDWPTIPGKEYVHWLVRQTYLNFGQSLDQIDVHTLSVEPGFPMIDDPILGPRRMTPQEAKRQVS